jgi:peptidase M23-like protein
LRTDSFKKLRSWPLSAATFLLLGQIFLYSALQLRPGPLAFIPYFVGPKLLLAAAVVCLAVALIEPVRTRSVALLKDRAWCVSLVMLSVVVLISLTAYRVFPSSHDGRPSKTCFRLPLKGDVEVVQGGLTLDVNYHAAFPAQRYAYDLALNQGGKTHRSEGYVVWDYYIYAKPVLAPADGSVIYTSEGDPDQSPSADGWLPYKSVAGNHVVIEVGPQEYVFLGHLQSGTIKVQAGERVHTGQELGRAGNSGRSGAPHLHIHLQDSLEFNGGEGIPMEFCNYLAYDLRDHPHRSRLVSRGIPTGRQKKQVVHQLDP